MEPEPCQLLAVALDGEDTFWLSDPKSKHPLPPDWRQTEGFWLYPVGNVVPPTLEASPFFDPTDCVFVLGKNSVSKILRLATLRTDVSAMKLKIGSAVFFLVKAEEVAAVDEAYKTLLKNEELAAAAKEKTPETPEPMPMETSPTSAEEKEEVVDDISEREAEVPRKTTYSRKRSSHGHRKSVLDTGTVRNTCEVQHWDRFFIVHRGGVPVLCADFTGNYEGFRLTRVLHDGFAIFLLFLSTEDTSVRVEPTEIGVPVLQCALLFGEETEFKRERSVMIFTRAVGSRKGIRGRKEEDISAQAKKVTVVKYEMTQAEKEAVSGMNESDFSEDELASTDSSDSDSFGRTRKRRRRKLTMPAMEKSASHTSRRDVAKRSLRRLENSESDGGRGQKHVGEPLTTVGVNLYRETDGEVPSAAPLSQSFPLLSSSVAGLSTAVLPNGVAVTYTPTCIDKLNSTSETGHSESNHDAVRGLLENIKMAQEQVNAIISE